MTILMVGTNGKLVTEPLPVTKKIIEEHGGTLVLTDADPLDASGQIGARAEITLPISTERETKPDLQVAE